MIEWISIILGILNLAAWYYGGDWMNGVVGILLIISMGISCLAN